MTEIPDDTRKRKLIIQIPCFNEEDSLPVTLKALPLSVAGYDTVEVLVIDDGSTDRTVDVARALGVHHIVRHGYNRGLASAFMSGLEASVKLGAHTIVNTDADNQYCADDIEKLVQPILDNSAMVVIGTRPILQIQRFSTVKKFFQRFGSRVVRFISKTNIEDVPSGFRAIHRDVAKRLNIVTKYTYTIEMIIQLGYKNIPMTCVPIRVNPEELRPSRLIRSNLNYIVKSAQTIIHVLILFRPLVFFSSVSAVLMVLSLAMASRYIRYMAMGQGVGYMPALMMAIVLGSAAVMTFLTGLICNSVKVNRMLLEDIRYRLVDISEQ